jgi:raffinose/stachyose/melibiose transport system substrate-binding protein
MHHIRLTPAGAAPATTPSKEKSMAQQHSINRRNFLTGTGLAALGLAAPGLLAACGGGDNGSGGGTSTGGATGGSTGTSGAGSAASSAGGAPAEKTTVELWMDIQGDANQKYFDTNVIDAFHQAVPNVTVKVTYYKGQDLRQQIQTALQARSGPDIVRGPAATQTIAWSQAGVLADLTSYADKYGWADKLDSWAVEAFTQDKKIFALPLRFDTMMLYYNKTLFDSKGWQQPKNRSELEALAAEIDGAGITPFGTSNVDWKAASEWLMSIFFNLSAGPEKVYEALTGKLDFTDPVFVDSAKLLQSYFDKGWMSGGTDNYFAVPSQEIGANFGNGKVAMIPQGEWFMSQVGNYFGEKANNDNEWDWMPFPSLNDDVPYPTYPIGIGGSLAINEASSKKDAAAAFLNWYYTDRDAALQRMADVPATYNIPIPIKEGDLPKDMDPRSARVITEVNKAVDAGNYGYVTWTWWPPKSDVWVYQGFDQVLTKKITPEQYCQQLSDTFKQEQSKGSIPQIITRNS